MATINWKDVIKGKAQQSALKDGVDFALHDGSIAKVMHGYAKAFLPDHAPYILNEVRLRVMAERKDKGITKPLPIVQNSRVSEVRGILRLRDWACCDLLFTTLSNMGVPLDTLVKVSKHVRSNVDRKTGVCPSRKALLAVINARKKQRNEGNGKPRAINPVATIEAIEGHARKLAKSYGKADGHAFITAMLKACASYKPFATRIKAAADAEREAKKAKKAGK